MSNLSTALHNDIVAWEDTHTRLTVVEPIDAHKKYRTKSKAGNVAKIPSKVPIITLPEWNKAMTCNPNDKAYLQPLSDIHNLNFEKGMMYFSGLPATAVELRHLFTNETIKSLDLQLLRTLYGIIFTHSKETLKEHYFEEVITIYLPDLARALGKRGDVKRTDVDVLIDKITEYINVVGIINRGNYGNDILPVLAFLGYEADTNTIRIASPYINKVISQVYDASIRPLTTGTKSQKDSSPKLKPSHSFLIETSIAKEKNKAAIEIVNIVVTLIEQAGKHCPHISAQTILDRNPILMAQIANTADKTNKNRCLKRAFTKAWELLSSKTSLNEVYEDILLPNVNDIDFIANYIPTMATLNMTFQFPHKGKKPQKQLDQNYG